MKTTNVTMYVSRLECTAVPDRDGLVQRALIYVLRQDGGRRRDKDEEPCMLMAEIINPEEGSGQERNHYHQHDAAGGRLVPDVGRR